MPAFTTEQVLTAEQWAKDLRSRCTAAAKLAMTAEQWTPEDRAEVAAALAARFLHGLPRAPLCTAADCSGPADHWAPLTDDYGTERYAAPRCIRHRGTDYRRIVGSVAVLPDFSTLYSTACNLRRSIGRQRARDEQHAAEMAARSAFLPTLPDELPEVRNTPWGARRTALDMLRALGLDERAACRKGGPLWTAAYAAARAAAGLESEAIAAELELSSATYRQHLSRAAGRVPSVAVLPLSAHAAALGTIDTTPGLKAAKTREQSASMAQDWRCRAGQDYPVQVSTAAPREAVPPSWAVALCQTIGQRNTARRLHRAAAIQRARAEAKSSEQRAADRLAAGLPATVR